MDEIKKILTKLWNEFQEKERYLFENDLSERCISSNFAKCLVLSGEFDGYDIDCEYNRELNELKEIKTIKDKFSGLIKSGEISEYDEVEKYRVYPDIIIHQRGIKEKNFIVIEMKKNTQRQEAMEYDKVKLNAYKSQLGYQFAFFIKFGIGKNIPPKIIEIDELN